MDWFPAIIVGVGLFAAIGVGATFFGRWLSGEHTPVAGHSRARFVFSAALIGAVALRILVFSPLIGVAIACLLVAALVLAFTSAKKE